MEEKDLFQCFAVFGFKTQIRGSQFFQNFYPFAAPGLNTFSPIHNRTAEDCLQQKFTTVVPAYFDIISNRFLKALNLIDFVMKFMQRSDREGIRGIQRDF